MGIFDDLRNRNRPLPLRDRHAIDRKARRWCVAHQSACLAAGGGYFKTSELRMQWLCADALAKRAKPA